MKIRVVNLRYFGLNSGSNLNLFNFKRNIEAESRCKHHTESVCGKRI